MSVELNTLIDSELLKTTTDGLSAESTLKYNGSELEWTADTQKAYAGLLSTGIEDITVTADTAEDLTTATLWSTTANANTTIDLAAGTITLTTAGVYKLDSWLSLDASTTDTKLTVRYTINGVPSPVGLVGLSKVSGDTSNLSASGIFSFTAGSVIGLNIEADKNCIITIESCGLALHKIDGV